MIAEDDSIAFTYNGEIYNFRNLRTRLEAESGIKPLYWAKVQAGRGLGNRLRFRGASTARLGARRESGLRTEVKNP